VKNGALLEAEIATFRPLRHKCPGHRVGAELMKKYVFTRSVWLR
jgi:hypothetical protein